MKAKPENTTMRKLFSLLPLILMFPISLFSQKATLSGYVSDRSTGERLINANVYNPVTLKGTSTNNYGFFSLTLPYGEIDLSISFIGFKTQTLHLNLKKDTLLSIALELKEAIEEITVYGTGANKVENSEMSVVELPVRQIQKIPLIMGEPDVLKVIQLLPGVQSGTEGTSGIYVRGGGPDQNLFLLDGVPIYNVNHLFGFFSVFNPGAIKTVKLYKGGFPARFGGRLSSVIDINMKEGNMKKISGEASVGLISSRISIEGPIVKDKTSFIISGRRTYGDLLLQPILKLSMNYGNTDLNAGYYFYDLNAKINHIFSERSRLYLSGYFGQDKFYMNMKNHWTSDSIRYDEKMGANIGWGNGIGALRWNYLLSSRLFSNLTLTYSNYNFDVQQDFQLENAKTEKKQRNLFEYLSGIEDLSAKVDFDYYPNPQHEIKFGASYTYHTFNPGVNHFEAVDEEFEEFDMDTIVGNDSIFAHEFFGFLEDNFDLGPLFKLNLGLHFSGFHVQDIFYPSLQPRATIRFRGGENWSVKASYTMMSQNIHLLSSSTISLPTDLWLPTTRIIKPQISEQIALGGFINLPWNLDLSVEAYYKTMSNLIEYKDGASFVSSTAGWEKQIELGRGWSYGGEILLEKKVGKLTGWIGYTLSWSERQFDNLNFEKPFFARYDRRHDISITATYEFNERMDMGVTWVYGTGNAVTLGKQKFKDYDSGLFFWNQPLTYYEGRNNYRMPAYHRLDWGINFHRELKYGNRTLSFSVYNAYNRMNPFFLYWGYDYTTVTDPETGNTYEESEKALKQISIFPIIPSISYTYRF
ncbi:MAG TPA: TonB-dependent receptor [Prolixibacteraceae bacterium]|nr:TonB-dependent receptor [Prolixibacteraceae bacterium]